MDRINALYDTFCTRTYADKQTMAEYDFQDWPGKDPNFIAPVNFPQVMKAFDVVLTYDSHFGQDGPLFDWNFKGHTGQVKIAVYPSAIDA